MNTAIIDNTCDPCVVGAYHPPKPQYHVGSLLDYVEANVHEINHTFLDCIIILAGDFNQISYVDVIERIWTYTHCSSTNSRCQRARPHLRLTALLQFSSRRNIYRQKRPQGCRHVHRQEQVCIDKKDFS